MKRNLKPFIYLSIGIILLIILIYFKSLTNKIEHNNNIDLLIPLTVSDSLEDRNETVVKINKDLKVYVDDVEHNLNAIEDVLLSKAVNDSLTVILRVEKSVPVKHMINLMEVANKNKFKVILATNTED